MSKPYRVLIADDHPVVRQGIKQILQDAPDIAVGGEARDGDEVIKKLRAGRWDGLVLDFTMPARNGLDLSSKSSGNGPSFPC